MILYREFNNAIVQLRNAARNEEFFFEYKSLNKKGLLAPAVVRLFLIGLNPKSI